jgi:hypothetical protein
MSPGPISEFECQTVCELFRSEKGEDYLPDVIERVARNLRLTPQRLVIAAVHFLLFGTDGQGRPHIGEFAADPHGIRYRSETEEEEAFDDWLLRREQDFDH